MYEFITEKGKLEKNVYKSSFCHYLSREIAKQIGEGVLRADPD
jgi:hypothetical protein